MTRYLALPAPVSLATLFPSGSQRKDLFLMGLPGGMEGNLFPSGDQRGQ